MKRRVAAFLLLGVLGARGAFVFPQESGKPAASSGKITFTGAVGTGGTEIVVPMTLVPGPQADVKELALEFSFPDSKISLLKSELAYEATRAGAEAKVEQNGAGRVAVRIAVPKEREGTLPEGQIAYFTFKISHDAAAGDFAIGVRNVEMKDPEGKPLDTVREAEILVNVVSSKLFPMISCIFYMH